MSAYDFTSFRLKMSVKKHPILFWLWIALLFFHGIDRDPTLTSLSPIKIGTRRAKNTIRSLIHLYNITERLPGEDARNARWDELVILFTVDIAARPADLYRRWIDVLDALEAPNTVFGGFIKEHRDSRFITEIGKPLIGSQDREMVIMALYTSLSIPDYGQNILVDNLAQTEKTFIKWMFYKLDFKR